ncbi:hypothetical protein C8R44DRAFT_976531 [Mycena epipterygia]|nr:hypothetical protein C8R44DRAFT_976531 [Mycena epipterygia]
MSLHDLYNYDNELAPTLALYTVSVLHPPSSTTAPSRALVTRPRCRGCVTANADSLPPSCTGLSRPLPIRLPLSLPLTQYLFVPAPTSRCSASPLGCLQPASIFLMVNTAFHFSDAFLRYSPSFPLSTVQIRCSSSARAANNALRRYARSHSYGCPEQAARLGPSARVRMAQESHQLQDRCLRINRDLIWATYESLNLYFQNPLAL